MAIYGDLVATSGATTANSYSNVASADDYVDGIPATWTTVWDAATTEQKEDALMWATGILDRWVDWSGDKATSTQRLRWPRTGVYNPDGEAVASDSIPQFLVEATAELARKLLDKDLTEEPTRGIKRLRSGEVDITFDLDRQKRVLLKSVQAFIYPYGTIMENSSRRQVLRV